MKSGFREVADKVLRKYGLLTRDCVGTVWSDGDLNWTILNAMGYRVEKGIISPDYDYVILSKSKSTINNMLLALTRTKVGCIIMFRADGVSTNKLVTLANATGSILSFFHYDNDEKVLGVLFKTREF